MWQRYNGTSKTFEKSDDNGVSWAPLGLDGSIITQGGLSLNGNISMNDPGGNPAIVLKAGGVTKGYMGVQQADAWITGAAANTTFFRSEGAGFSWSASGGTAQQLWLTPTGSLGVSGGINIAAGPSSAPFTLTRVKIYDDSSNWAYLSYGVDASLRLAFARTAAGGPFLIGSSTGIEGAGVFNTSVAIFHDSLTPGSNGGAYLGTSALKWAQVWAVNGTIQTSDLRSKKDVVDSGLGLDFISRLKPIEFEYTDFVGRRAGFSTQNVLEAMGANRTGGIVFEGNDGMSGMNYAALTVPIIKAIQELKELIDGK